MTRPVRNREDLIASLLAMYTSGMHEEDAEDAHRQWGDAIGAAWDVGERPTSYELAAMYAEPSSEREEAEQRELWDRFPKLAVILEEWYDDGGDL